MVVVVVVVGTDLYTRATTYQYQYQYKVWVWAAVDTHQSHTSARMIDTRRSDRPSWRSR